MTCNEIAVEINGYLQRFEASKRANKPRHNGQMTTTPFYKARAWATTRVKIQYVSYQGEFALTKAKALQYLAWLRNGNIGKHFQMKETP